MILEGMPVRTYWVWLGEKFVGWVQTNSRESAARAFGLDPSGLRVALEEELSVNEWVAADVQMRD